ncbi:hypothetical protein DNS57_14360 [Salmonella enterica]|nr:hypothetical protein [Salmonella enterica]
MSVTIIEEMIGQTFDEVSNDHKVLIFSTNYSQGYRKAAFIFFHDQDCCESVWIEDITGDLSDLLESPITEAEVVTETCEIDSGRQTWSFFKFGTARGCVTVRWCGESNGFYSESVSLRIESTKIIDY